MNNRISKNIYLGLVLIFSIVIKSFAQSTDANIIGHVVCGEEHIPFITITVEGTTIGAITDATGHYRILDMPIGEFTIVASGVGYKTSKKVVTTSKNITIELNFELEEDVLNLEEFIVTADRNATKRSESPVVVNSISNVTFKKTQSINVAEGINFTPGIRTETNCQNCGFTQIRMNGLDGSYSQILINSKPVFSGLAGVYGLEMIPSNMIERLEVVKGGGSSLFGGNAIAGTVNVITKEPVNNSFVVDFRSGIIGLNNKGGSNSLDYQININTSLITDDRKTGGYLYASTRNRNPYDSNNDGFSEIVKLKNTIFGFNFFHKPTSKNIITIDGYRISEFRRGGNKMELLPHEADITEQLKHEIIASTISYNHFLRNNKDKLSLFGSIQYVDRDSYYGAMQDPNAYGVTKNLTSSVGVNYVLNIDKLLFAPSTTIFGISNDNDNIKDNKLGTLNNQNTLIIDQYINTTGLFIQHDWKANKLNLSLGVRYDYYFIKDNNVDNNVVNNDVDNNVDNYNIDKLDSNLSNGVFIPRLNVMYKILNNLKFRIGYAKGYRAPQIFNEDLHVELVNAHRVKTINSINLKQESSHAFTASLDYDFTLFNTTNDLLIEGFYTLLKDPFASVFYELEDGSGDFAYLRVNAEDGAYVGGVNLEYNSYVSKMFNYKLGFTLQQSKYQKPQQWGDCEEHTTNNFLRTPSRYGFAVFSFNFIKNLNVDLSFNYTGPMLVPHFGVDIEDFDDPTEIALVEQAILNGDIIQGEELVKTKDILVVDLLTSYKFNLTKEIGLELYFGVKNIFNQTQKDFDKGIFRDASYIYGPLNFRTINIGVKIGHLN